MLWSLILMARLTFLLSQMVMGLVHQHLKLSAPQGAHTQIQETYCFSAFFRRKFSILMAFPNPNRCRPPNLRTHTLNFLKDSRNAQALVQVFPFKGTTIIQRQRCRLTNNLLSWQDPNNMTDTGARCVLIHTEAGSNEITIKLLIGGQFPVKIGKGDIWLISIFNWCCL